MSHFDLKGKTVMLAAGERGAARNLKEALESLGAQVLTADYIPLNIIGVCDVVQQHKPKIDALILYAPAVAIDDNQFTSKMLAKRLKADCPVIVCDQIHNKATIQSLQDAGVKYLNFRELTPEVMAFNIAHTTAKHGSKAASRA